MRGLLLIGAAMLVATAGASPAQADDWCPATYDLEFKNGATLPDHGSYCDAEPRTGRQACSAATRGSLPDRLSLRVGRRSQGVGLGTKKAKLCERWGRPVLATGSAARGWAFYYGSDAPVAETWKDFRRTSAMLGYIISWCRYHGRPFRGDEERYDPSCDDNRLAQRQEVLAGTGALGQLLAIRAPQSADWVQVNLAPNGRVRSIGSWRQGDEAHGLKVGFPPPDADDCAQRFAGPELRCFVPQQSSSTRCRAASGENDTPHGGATIAQAGGRPLALGGNLRTVGVFVAPGRCPTS